MAVTLGRRAMMLAGAAWMAAPGLGRADGLQVLGGDAFGSYWRIVLPGAADGAAVTRAVASVVARTDAVMSPYRAKSELSLLNASQGTGWRRVSPELDVVAGAALEAASKTGGAFDPGVGGVVGRLGFGPISAPWLGRDRMDRRPGALRKREPGATMDLCGIAKGWALDRIGAALAGLGQEHALIELGGEVLALGRHPGGRPWRVAIDSAGDARAAVEVPDGLAIATSGDAPQGYDIGKRRYGHIIDPVSGDPVRAGLAAVSVLAETAMEADALATAIFAAGPGRAEVLAGDLTLGALFVPVDGAPRAFGRMRGLVLG